MNLGRVLKSIFFFYVMSQDLFHIRTLEAKFAVLRIRDVYPGTRILIFTHPGSRISDLGSRIQKQQQKRGVKKNLLYTFFFSHKFHIIENYFIFEMLKKKIRANFQRIIELFTQKLPLSSQKYGFGIRKKPIPDPGVKKAPDHGSESATLEI
jgi:hypothetical protein